MHNNTNGGRNLGSQGSVQYGLIAEEVDKVYPELVIRDHSGKIQGVRYEQLAPMLLSSMQKQRRVNAAQAKQIEAQSSEILALKQQVAELNDLRQELHAAVRHLQTKDALVASASASN